jgi:uncharacterized protein
MRSLLNEKPVSCVRNEDGTAKLSGYAAVYYSENEDGTEYQMFGNVRERIMPGAFDGMVGRDIISTFNHDPNQLLGRTSSGTLRYSVDERGLFYEVDLPDTQLGRDTATLAERGDLDGSSFWFDFHGSEYEKRTEEGGEIWELKRVEGLVEFGPVTVPAYKATTAYKRSADLVREQIEAETAQETNKANTERLRLLAMSKKAI